MCVQSKAHTFFVGRVRGGRKMRKKKSPNTPVRVDHKSTQLQGGWRPLKKWRVCMRVRERAVVGVFWYRHGCCSDGMGVEGVLLGASSQQ